VLLARQGRRAAAHADAEGALRLDDRPAIQYQVAGIYAQTSRQHPEDRADALHYLEFALWAGYGLDLVPVDRDLDPVRALPGFRRAIERAQSHRDKKNPGADNAPRSPPSAN
jgi:hypothetical protein